MTLKSGGSGIKKTGLRSAAGDFFFTYFCVALVSNNTKLFRLELTFILDEVDEVDEVDSLNARRIQNFVTHLLNNIFFKK